MVQPTQRRDAVTDLLDTPATGVYATAIAQGPSGPSPRRLRPQRWLARTLIVTSVGLCALSLAVPNVWPIPPLADPDSPIRKLVAVSDEQNLPTWFNVVLLAHATTASAIVAALLRRTGQRRLSRGWTGLALITALLSLDDLASIHEQLEPLGRNLGGGSGALHFAWVVPGAAAGALVVTAVVPLVRHSYGPTRTYLVGGTGLLIGSALGLETINGLVLDKAGPSPAYVIGTTLEELCEAIGAALLACAPLTTLDVRLHPDHTISLGIDPAAIPARPRHLKRPAPSPGTRGRQLAPAATARHPSLATTLQRVPP